MSEDNFNVPIAPTIMPTKPVVAAQSSGLTALSGLMKQNFIVAIIIVLVIILVAAIAFFFYRREKKKTVLQEQLPTKVHKKQVAQNNEDTSEQASEPEPTEMHQILVKNLTKENLKDLRTKITNARKTFDERFQAEKNEPIAEVPVETNTNTNTDKNINTNTSTNTDTKIADVIVICDYEDNHVKCKNVAVEGETRCNAHNI